VVQPVRNGSGHLSLSLYVTLIDKLDSGSFVNALLQFFIYDQIRNNYLTFLDVGYKRFHALKTEWGIPKLLSLESFTDASNGFLVNDSCSFGAEVLVRNAQIKRSSVSLLKSECERCYTWKIENFSDLNKRLESPAFSKLGLYPRGDNRVKGKHLSLFLWLDNANDLTHGSNLYTEYSLCIKNQNGIGAVEKGIGQSILTSY
ncbi:Ubiquitin carboxyl-terminal hydrolase 12, partial [Bienertia sinuspersici]